VLLCLFFAAAIQGTYCSSGGSGNRRKGPASKTKKKREEVFFFAFGIAVFCALSLLVSFSSLCFALFPNMHVVALFTSFSFQRLTAWKVEARQYLHASSARHASCRCRVQQQPASRTGVAFFVLSRFLFSLSSPAGFAIATGGGPYLTPSW
jgi:hypothetical protein